MNSNGGLEQLIFLAIAMLYGIGVGIYRFVKWANRQIAGVGNTPNPIQQAIADAQRQAPPRPSPAFSTPVADEPIGPDAAMEADFRRREQELRAESERAYAYFRRRAEELKAERERLRGVMPQATPPSEAPNLMDAPPPLAVPLPSNDALAGLFQTKGDLVRAFILREALGPPLSRRPSPRRKRSSTAP